MSKNPKTFWPHPNPNNSPSLHGQTSVVIRANTVNWGLPTNLLQYTMMTSAFVSNCSFGNMIAQYDTMITSACREMTSANSVRQRYKNDVSSLSCVANTIILEWANNSAVEIHLAHRLIFLYCSVFSFYITVSSCTQQTLPRLNWYWLIITLSVSNEVLWRIILSCITPL